MKQTRLWLTTIATLLCSLAASAHNFEVGGIYYNITSPTDLTVAVTYRGNNYDSYFNEYSGAVTIPETVIYNNNTYSVTSIGYAAFEYCSSLTSITIPEGVTSIGSSAFSYCSSLTAITIPEGVTSIGNYAFDNCTALKKVIIEDGSTTLSLGYNYYYNNGSTGQGLFYDCPLEEVYLGRNLSYSSGSSYGYSPFYNSNRFPTISLGNNVTSIPSYLFYNNSSLTSITLPEGVTSIGSSAFRDCRILTSITLPEGVTSIGNYAFEGCRILTSITIPEGVTSIGDEAFQYCSSLTAIIVEEGNEVYDSRNGCNAIIETNSNTLIQGCSTTIIPEGVTSIGRSAFSYCSSLTSITIPEGVTSIGSSAFSYCSSLTSITIPEGVTSIGSSAFYNCSSLYKVINRSNLSLTKGSSSNGYVAYYAKVICQGDELTTVGDYQFYTSDGIHSLVNYIGNDTEIVLPDSYNGENYKIGDYAFYGCSSLTAITIPEGVTSIGDYAFDNCTALKKVIIEDGSSTLSLGYNGSSQGLFYECPLEEVYLGRNLSYSSGSYSSPFYNKDALTNVTIGDEVTQISEYAFYGCDNIHSLTIPSGVLSIGSNAFSTPEKVIWLTNTPPTGYTNAKGSINYAANDQHSSLSKVKVYPYLSSMFEVDGVKYVPVSPSERTCHAIDCAYDSTAMVINLGETAIYKRVEMKVTEVMPYTFYGNEHIKEVSVSHLGNLGDYAFYDCDAIETAIVANEGAVGDQAFSGCSSLNAVTLGDSIGSLGYQAFYQCSSLQEIVIPDSVKSVGQYCFSGCTAMKSATIGDGVTAINNYAFQYCSSLPEITLPQAVTKVGDYVFVGCSKLADVVIADRTTALALGSNGSSALFADCPLDSVYIGGKITYNTTSGKGYSPFYRNTSLRTVVITDREEQIYDNEFYGCTNLQDVTIGNGVKSIGNYAFSGCSSLAGFSFGSNMETIGAEAFSDCTSLTSITSHAAVPPTCGAQALDDINKWSCTLRVPSGYAAAYQTADQWKEFFFVEDVVEVAKYKLTYMIDGEVYYTDSLVHKAEVTVPEVPEREGYTFSGWGEVPETMPAEDVTISGFFTVNKYLVTFVIDGEVIASDSLEYGASIVAPVAPEKEGHTFNGWGEVAETVPAEDVTYYGSYSVNSYLLTYVVDGETVQSDSVAYGSTIVALEEPAKEGYTFSGWSEIPETMPAEDVTISGFFTINRYLVTFVIDDEVIASDSLEYGASIVAPVAPEKEGHTFNGWGEVAETVPAEDVTYYGSYSVNSYLLTYVVDGATVQSDSVAYGSTIVALEEPTKEGHTFSGWGEVPETMPAEDVTISGFFTVNKYLVTFVIDGEVIVSDSLEYGSAIVAPEAPEKEGHTFNGWGEVAEMVPAEDVTYYGSYSVNSYLLTYVVDGETVQSDSVAYGSTIVALEEPAKEGHTFSGWSEIPETMPAEDVTISGFFTVNIYKVYYYVGDELVHTAEVAYGEAIPEYVYEPTAEGDVFVGWVGETYETMPAHDVTYTANIESGIEEIENSKLGIESSVIYDLHGRKIQVDDLRELERGVYIIDNKKVVIK